MEMYYSAEVPVKSIRKGTRRTLNYNVRELSEEEIKVLWDKEAHEDGGTPYDYFAKEHRYSYNSLTMGSAKWNYGGIVEAIIRDKYTTDEMEAITNNMNSLVSGFFNVLVTEGIVDAIKHLVDSKDDSNSEAFREMQLWRAMAKREAKSVLKME